MSGEPGIGKTRLVDELAEIAAARGFTVVRGSCWEAGGAPPYWPWIQVLRGLGDGGDPAIARLLGGGELHAGEQVFLFDAIARRLADAAAAAPLLVILEDLHAADRSSLLLSAFVAGALRASRALVVGTHRDGAAWLADGTAAQLSRIARHGQALSLGRLSAAEVAALLQRAGESPESAGELHAISAGNPLFVHELLRIGWRGRRAGEAVPLSESIEVAVREHLAAVAAPVRELLEVAAAVGRECGSATLAEMAGQPREQVAAMMASAAQVGLVDERAPGLWAFSHGLVRETLHRGLSADRRAELHARAANALGRLHAGDPAAPLVEVAHHLLLAGPASAARAIDAAARAARRASQVAAHEEAVELLERALAALASSAPGDVRRRAELLVALAEAQASAGHGDAGRLTSRQACEIARLLDDGPLFARAALGYGAEARVGVVDPALVQLLEEALERVGDDDALRARLFARLAGALQPAFDDGPIVRLGRQAVEHAGGLADDEVRLAVLRDAGAALFLVVPPDERIALDQEMIRLAAARGDEELVLRGRTRLVFDLVDRAGPADEAAVEEQLRACTRTAADARRPHLVWRVAMLHAMRAACAGRFADGERRVQEALQAAERGRDAAAATVCARLHRFHVLRLQGRFDEAGELLPDLDRATGRDPVVGALHDLAVWPRAGAPERARPALARFLVPGSRVAPLTLVVATDACIAVGDRDAAVRLYRALEPYAGTVVSWGPFAMHVEGLVDGARMRLAAALGDREAATRHAETALATARRLGALPHLVALLADRAAILVAGGGAGDQAVAGRLLEEARRTAQAIGMDVRQPVQQPPAAPPPAPGELRLALEGEIWTASLDGEMCRLRDSGGLRIVAELVARPGGEVHVLDLVSDRKVVDPGDHGEVLDARARGEIAQRLEHLRGEIAQSESWNDAGRASRARAEAAVLTSELARAVGLGGRPRRSGAAAERARVNVQRQVAAAIRRVRDAAPGIGRHLAATIRTGTFCSYQPEEPRRSR